MFLVQRDKIFGTKHLLAQSLRALNVKHDRAGYPEHPYLRRKKGAFLSNQVI